MRIELAACPVHHSSPFPRCLSDHVSLSGPVYYYKIDVRVRVYVRARVCACVCARLCARVPERVLVHIA